MPVLTLVCCLFAVPTRAQSVPVTLRVADVPLEQMLNAIEKQTTYLFVYDKSVDVTRKISLDVEAMPLKGVLENLFRSTDIAYAVEKTSIVLSRRAVGEPAKAVTVSGVVVDAAGQGMVGVAVVVKGTAIGASTDVNGAFSLQIPPPPRRPCLRLTTWAMSRWMSPSAAAPISGSPSGSLPWTWMPWW